MDDLTIEREVASSASAIDDVVRRAFSDHPGVADMVVNIRKSSRYRNRFALVARLARQTVGFVMLSGTDLVDDRGRCREVLTLTPLAVVPEFEGRGIGSALVRTALDAADGNDEPLVVLEGSPRYYGRLGFRYAPDHGISIDLPEWAPREAAQVFLLTAYDPAVRGHVQYPPAIAAVSG